MEESQAARSAHATVETTTKETTLTVAAKPVTCAKKVSFSPYVAVILIPCLEEYHEAGATDSVWWSAMERKQFRIEVFHLLRRYTAKFAHVSGRQALRILVAHPEEFLVEDISLPTMPSGMMV